ncbi:3-hydroxyisobutyrate dehydrogenase [Jannaschia sp. M317]|uniref:3-hydroxyisobutyrate dehydrogenase n=1 Tax=Jannaschia sp. M317 TaxID=2867011 RepID=UPI0021A81522|nr:3-hydroxyisobutyrate dehydrogenase [Jannaschia sp. M317]
MATWRPRRCARRRRRQHARPLAQRHTPTGGHPMNIAFIGLGNMGAPMARNLARAGHTVAGYDKMAPAPEGVTAAASATEAVAGAEVVITMLPNGAILRTVADEVIPAMAKGAVLLDCSTVDVDSARAVADQALAAGLGALDAPVSGGIGGADAGTLTFMVGGSDSALATAAPLLDIMGGKTVHCGPSGNGQAAKICNNMILGATMAVTCEAFALADKLGLDRQAMYDVASMSSGQSWSLTSYCPAPGVGPTSPSDNAYKPGFAAELMLKDLDLALQAAQIADSPTPLGTEALAQYRAFVEAGGKGRDFSALLPHFASKSRD